MSTLVKILKLKFRQDFEAGACCCEGANSKLVEVVTVADVSDEDRVGNRVLQILELRFGQKA